jgi:hypothetical protein
MLPRKSNQIKQVCDFGIGNSLSEVRAFRRLGQLLVRGSGHKSPELDENRLHGEVTLPSCYAGKLA